MRLSWLAWLGLPLLCSASCESADSCGPTSDWPTCNQGTPSGSGTDDNSESPTNNPPKDPGGGKKDSGSTKPPALDIDAGVRSDASSPAESDLDGGKGAAGDAAGDGDVPSFDGGPTGCTIDSDGRDAGACFGVYCDVSQAMFSKLVSDQGACLGAGDLALACDGELARVIAKCAQDDVLMLGFGRTVALCAARAPSLASASEGCIGCYVDETLCALQSCLAACLSGSADDCTQCRRENCRSGFSDCSGLPD